MASFFGMGRAPHQLSLRVTYEGYAKNPEDPDAPIPREGTRAVDWEAAEETSAVLERIDAQMRTLPFNHKGQVVALRLDASPRTWSTAAEHAAGCFTSTIRIDLAATSRPCSAPAGVAAAESTPEPDPRVTSSRTSALTATSDSFTSLTTPPRTRS